jgi:uncharacterized protein (DUF1800 family)
VAADRLKLEHHVREPLRSRALAPQLPRDVVVLAEHAAQVAAAEEDRSRAAATAQAVLLAEVREVRSDDGVTPDAAQPRPVGEPVDLAQARADQAATLEQAKRPARPLA